MKGLILYINQPINYCACKNTQPVTITSGSVPSCPSTWSKIMCNGIARRCMLLTLGRKIPGLKCHSGYRWAGKSTHSWEWWQLCIQTLAARDTEIAEAESLQVLDRQDWDESQQGEGLGGCCWRAAGSSLFKLWCRSVSGISYRLKINQTRISAYRAARPLCRSAQRGDGGAEGTTALSWPWVLLACLCTSGCGRVNSSKPWLRCVVVAMASKPRDGVSAQSHPGDLFPWSWHGHYILHCFVSYRCFYKCFRAGLEYWLVFTLPPKTCVGLFLFLFFHAKRLKWQLPTWGDSAQSRTFQFYQLAQRGLFQIIFDSILSCVSISAWNWPAHWGLPFL